MTRAECTGKRAQNYRTNYFVFNSTLFSSNKNVIMVFRHGCSGHLSSSSMSDNFHYSLGINSLASVRAPNAKVVMVLAWMLWLSGSINEERYHGLGMDALTRVCARNAKVVMVWPWMLWQPYAFGTREKDHPVFDIYDHGILC